jgi:hypothetical protein
MFQDEKPGRLIRVGRNGALQVQDENGQFRAFGPGDAPFNKDADQVVQEPAPQSSGAFTDPRRIATFNGIANAADRSPLIKAADRTIVLGRAIDDILGNASKKITASPTDPAKQMNLAYSYIQALDTYQSAVREGELGNLGMLGTQLEQLGVAAKRTAFEGAFMPKNVAENIARAAKVLNDTIQEGAQQKRQEFRNRAKASKVEDLWDEAYPQAQPQAEDKAPKPAGATTYTRDANGRLVRK